MYICVCSSQIENGQTCGPKAIIRHLCTEMRKFTPRIYIHILIFPSHPAEITLEVSCGCHRTEIQTLSCAFHVDTILCVRQSHMNTFPSASPEVRKLNFVDVLVTLHTCKKCQLPHFWREINTTCIAGDIVAAKGLLFRKPQLIVDQLKEYNTIIHALTDNPLL